MSLLAIVMCVLELSWVSEQSAQQYVVGVFTVEESKASLEKITPPSLDDMGSKNS